MSSYSPPDPSALEADLLDYLTRQTRVVDFLEISDHLFNLYLDPAGEMGEKDFERLTLFEDHQLPDLLDHLVADGKLLVSADADGFCNRYQMAGAVPVAGN